MYNLQRDITIEILLNNKIITIEKALKSYIHSTLLNPVEVLFTRIKGKEIRTCIHYLNKNKIKYSLELDKYSNPNQINFEKELLTKIK